MKSKLDLAKSTQVTKNSIHNWEQKIVTIKNQINTELSTANSNLIEKYDRTMVNQSIQKATRALHLNRLLYLSRRLNKDWHKATKEDIERIVFEIMDTYSVNGKDTNYTYDHKKVLKIFFRWFKLGNRDYKYCLKKHRVGDPEETEDIVMKKPENNLKGEDLITDEEREWLLDACELSRDRALIDVGLDGGLRPEELLTITIGSIKQDKISYVIYVDGKTGPRTVRLMQSTPSLARWLAEHPFKENSQAPLWITFEKTKYGKLLTYTAARALLGRVCAKVRKKHPQFQKRIFLNLFRHTEATKAAKFMNDAITKKRHGWSSISRMPARYTHLQNSDVDEIILKHYGVETNEEEKPKIPKRCNLCDMINDYNSKMCSKCGKPLDLQTALEIEENEKKENEVLSNKVNNLEDNLTKVTHKLDLVLKTMELNSDIS